MLSDSLFEVGCNLASAIKGDQDVYPVEILQQVYDSWFSLEKIRIKLDQYPGTPELSENALNRIVKDSISSYLDDAKVEFDQLVIKLT